MTNGLVDMSLHQLTMNKQDLNKTAQSSFESMFMSVLCAVLMAVAAAATHVCLIAIIVS